MKSFIRISLSLVFTCAIFSVSAQSDPKPQNTSRVVSKDVQRYSNKSLSEPSGIQVTSAAPSEHVNSKMKRRSTATETTSGNMKSTGMPARAISKSVNLINRK